MAVQLHPGRLRAGVWEAAVTAAHPPRIEAVHQGMVLPGPEIVARAGRKGEWTLRLSVPATLLEDGVQTFVLRDRDSGATLGHFTIVAGAPLEADLRAEIDLLRAEVDLLQRAFRQHLREGAMPAP